MVLLELSSIQEVEQALFSIPTYSSPDMMGLGQVCIKPTGILLAWMW